MQGLFFCKPFGRDVLLGTLPKTRGTTAKKRGKKKMNKAGKISGYRTIEVDEHGCSCIVAVNGDEEPQVGSYGDLLASEDEVELSDGSVWTVAQVYSHIQTGNPGSGLANFVAVDLVQRDEE